MSITQNQFEQLTEMGISLWQHRSCAKPNNETQTETVSYLDIDLAALASQQLFTDILLASGLTIGEVSHQSDHLDLGLFNWYFTANLSADESSVQSSAQSHKQIQWHEQQLFTPSIADISKSPALKRQLWHLLGNQAQ